MSNTLNVSSAKPKIGGAISRAPLGTALPENATEALASAFKQLGYVSEDGLTNTNTFDSNNVASWDGDTVLTTESNKVDTFKYKLLEVLNTDVLKSVYGDENVTGDLQSGITVRANANPQQEYSWVVDMIMKNGVLKRIVIPQAKVSAVEDIVYKNNEAIGYDTTISASPYAEYDGDTHREFIIQGSESL